MQNIRLEPRGRKRRRGLSAKKRFRVLNRDNFTCRYCGQSAPSVVLHVDHITPVCFGGDNDEDNLVAACQDCNAGKSTEDIINQQEQHQQTLYSLLWPYLTWPKEEQNAAISAISRAYACGYEASDLDEIGRVAECYDDVSVILDWLSKQGLEE